MKRQVVKIQAITNTWEVLGENETGRRAWLLWQMSAKERPPRGRKAFKQGSLTATSAAQDFGSGPFFPRPSPALTPTLTPSLNSHLWKLDSPPFSFGLWDPMFDLSRAGPWALRVNSLVLPTRASRTVSPITSRWRHPPRTLVPTQDSWSQRPGPSWPAPLDCSLTSKF